MLPYIMSFTLNETVNKENIRRCYSSEYFYMKLLKSKGMLLEIENIAVDSEQLIYRTFICNPKKCIRKNKKKGYFKYSGSCCTDLEVNITPAEASKIILLAEKAVEEPNEKSMKPYEKILKRISSNSFTQITEKGELALQHHIKSGRCVLSYINKNMNFLCVINELCGILNLKLEDYKPDPCFLFPLHYVEYKPGFYFLTVISEESFDYIGSDESVAGLSCLSKTDSDNPPAYISLEKEITYCFGKNFFRKLDETAKKMI
jgi:hypothetical protein